MEQKTCKRCERSLLISEFNWKNTVKGIHQSWCKQCQRNSQNDFYSRNTEYRTSVKTAAKLRKKQIKIKFLEYLKRQQCLICGENDPVVLTHDHRDPAIKTECVSIMVQHANGWDTIQKEIDKCDVLCFNCHARRTAKNQKWYESWILEVKEANKP